YFGNVIGRSPHWLAESDQHHGNLYAVLVGPTAMGRKGTSEGRTRAVFARVDDVWVSNRIKSGLSSGEGFIYAVRDKAEKWNVKEKCVEVVDEGVNDKRLLVIEPEFASVLTTMERPGNTLSANLRNAWDGRTLEPMTKNNPIKATGAHVSVIGHITPDE